MNTFNRLQFRHHGVGSGWTVAEGVFETRDDAINYIFRNVKYAEDGLVSYDVTYGLSLFGEPTVLRYKNEEREDDPHLILVIGSVTNEDENTRFSKNRFCIIDPHKTQSEIDDLYGKIEELMTMLTIVGLSSDTINMYAERTDEGTIISGDVRLAEYQVYDRISRDNNILATEDGLFLFVDLDYDDNTGMLSFMVNGDKKSFKVNGNYIVSGVYKPEDESLHIRTRFGNEVTIDLENLIAEWFVEGEATKSPIVLTRKEVGYGEEYDHSHVEPWQDVLSADVRIADERVNNILKKTTDNRYLYVDGVATNIVYYSSTGKTDVQTALDDLSKMRISTDSNNIITSKADGFFASTKLEYISSENTLVFTTSTNEEGERKKETRIALNSFQLFDDIYYEASTESLVILYTDGNGKQQRVKIPIGEMMRDWEWTVNNVGHNIYLQKDRMIHGSDQLSADAKILDVDDNILTDSNHMLYVKGTADNIKYGRNSNVQDEIDALKDKDDNINARLTETSGKVDTLRVEFDAEVVRAIGEEQRIDDKLDAEIERSESTDAALDNKINIEIERATDAETALDGKIDQEIADREAADTILDNKIGTGFTDDPHDNVTYKFEQLQNQVNEEADKLQNEIDRSTEKDTEHDGKIEAIEDEIGEGFGPRNTVRDEIDALNVKVGDVIDDVATKLVDIINEDHSIDVDKTNPTEPVIKVNLSSEIEDNKPNIIKLNTDGLYAGVDLIYEFNEEVGTNQLIFKTTNSTKVYDLKTNSVVDKIYYDPVRESIIIEYTVNGHRMPDVVIPVGDLINEWRIWDGHEGAVQLEKVRIASGTTDKDVLKASVVISDVHDDNIIINDNGALYVSGKGITDNAAAIEAEIDRASNAETILDEKIDAEIERATAREDALEGRINEIDDEYLINFDNTNTISISKTEASKGYIVKANVNIDGSDDNNIKETANGIYSTVDLTYDETSNRLTFTNTNGSKEISLISNSIIDKIYYDPVRESIIIEYTVNGHRMPDVVVPVRDLINEIDVEDTDTVDLTKSINPSTGADVISANVKLNTYHNDNILVNDGGLYVPGQGIIDNANAISALEDRMDSAEGDIDTLESGLANEISRATLAEERLSGSVAQNTSNIESLTERVSTIEGEVGGIDRAIQAEETRAREAETALRNDLNSEITNRINGDNTLQGHIDNERSERITSDTSLNNAITSETATRSAEDARIEGKLDQEIARSTNKDNDLQSQVTEEATTARAAESSLREGLTTEIANRTVADSNLQTQITNEVERAQGAENALDIRIQAEKEARESEDEHIWAKIRPIEFYDTSTIHNERIRNSGENPDEVRHSLIISQADDNIIVANDTLGGAYATARLSYNESANALSIYGSNNKLLNTVTLGPGSIIKDISYDSTEKDLVITYRRAGDDHDTIMKFPVADLFNEWDIQNPSEGSALELHKVSNTTETGTVDILWGRVLLTGAVERPDGTIDYGDNIIRIVNNGLYASGSAITESKEIAECTRSELRKVEAAVLGSDLSEGYVCGSGYTYQPNERACFINTATSMKDADDILDEYVCSAHTRIDNVEEDVACLKQEVNITQENVLGFTIPECGLNGDGTPYKYQPNVTSCVISAATNMNEADILLDQAICEISSDIGCSSVEIKKVEEVLGVHGNCGDDIAYPKTENCLLSNATSFAQADAIMESAICSLKGLLEGSDTPTASMVIVDRETRRQAEVNVRLSHGNNTDNWQTDEDLTVTDYQGDGFHEFTDTNVLRVVDLTESYDMKPESRFNGLYLSNDWDCGLYYSETEDAEAIAEAEAAGYNTNYRTDENPDAYNFNYMNNVRQHDPLN